MKETHILLVGMILVILALVSYRVTYALFSDSATSTSNVFAAASIFPTATISPTPTPTPTGTPTVSPGDVVINEIMWMGSQGNAADEWIELRNMTSNVIDLSNWVVDNLGTGVNNNIVIPPGKSIAANGFFVIANDVESTSIMSVTPDHQTSSVSLLNPGEQLVLKTATVSGLVVDTANGVGGWLAGADNPERSMERNAVPGDGTVAGSWHSASASANLDFGASESATPRTINSTP